MREGVVARVDLLGVSVLDDEGRSWTAAVPKRLQDPGARLGNAIVVGDRVRLEARDREERAVVVDRAPRRNVFERRAAGTAARCQVIAANLDEVVAVASLRDPRLVAGVVDRYALAAEHAGLALVVVLTKVDRAGDDELARASASFERAGYPVVATAGKSGRGVPELARRLAGKRSLFVGHSGVGKSTLLNALSPGLGLRIGEVSAKTGKGRHTTTAALLVRLDPDGGETTTEVIDTPGVRTFGLPPIPPGDLAGLFPEWRVLGPCRFADCAHRGEPGCVRARAVAEGRMDESRYRSYLKLRGELEESVRR